MTYLIREYLPEESELACDVRGLTAQESRDRFKKRLETALELGIAFEVAPKLSLEDGIEAVRKVLPNCWFDKNKCH